MKTKLFLLILCVCHFHLTAQKSFESHTKKDGLTSSEVTVTLVDSKGVVWIGTSNGLTAYSGSKWYALKNIEDSKSGKPKTIGRVNVLFEDSKRNIWVGSSEGLFIYNSKYWTSFVKEDDDKFIPKFFMEDRQGRLWITSEYLQVVNASAQMNFSLSNGMLHMYSGDRWVDFNDIIGGTSAIIPGYTTDYFTRLFQDSKGNIWLSSMEGAFEFDGVNWKTYKEKELKSEKVLFVLEDKDGNIWAAMDNGVARQGTDGWKHYNKKDGLSGNRIVKLQQDNKIRIWAFAYNNLKFAGLGLFKEGKWQSFTKNDFKLKDEVESLTMNGEDVIAFAKGGVAVFKSNGWYKYGKKDGLIDKEYSMIKKDRHGIWLAGENAFYQFNEGSWEQLLKADGKWDVNVIFVENKESIWLGTGRDGIYHYSENKMEHFTEDSGLADDRILDIFKDKNEAVWIVSKLGVTLVHKDK